MKLSTKLAGVPICSTAVVEVWVIGVSVGWTHDSSPFVRMCRNLPNISEWNILVHNFAGASVRRLVLILVVSRPLPIAAAVFAGAEQ